MNILIVGINYAPEMVGIGPYTAGMAQFLAASGHCVSVVCAKPYYPDWVVDPAYSGGGVRSSVELGVHVLRVPTYVPTTPNGKRRLAHHLSFAARARSAALSEAVENQPDIVICIAPSLISMMVARQVARRTGAKLWLHIQDFEVEAAFATGLLKERGILAGTARKFEKWAMDAERISTISPQMCSKLIEKGIPAEKIVEFRNWASIDEVVPLEGPSSYRKEWVIDRAHVALYSGNIANKQGIEIVLAAAQLLQHRKDLIFIVCGNGPNRAALQKLSSGLDNIQFHDLQPRDRLSELLGLATVHLLPQIAGAADLVLPSKLTNMLASGRPVIATAMPQTGLADEVAGCGLTTTPGDTRAFAQAIESMIDDDKLCETTGQAARTRAMARWSKLAILEQFEKLIVSLKNNIN